MKLYYTTFPDAAAKDRIADKLVEERLAGCVVATDVDSLYLWDETKQEDDEIAVLFKTTEARADEFLVTLDEEHPYDVPCILEIPVAANKSYDQWLHEATDSIVDRSTGDDTVLVRFDIGPIFRVDTNMAVSEAAAHVKTPDVSGELAELLTDITSMRDEYGRSEDVYPIIVNGQPSTLYDQLSTFADDEPVHVALR
jgi:periplasmic divalent cation tolerance protein